MKKTSSIFVAGHSGLVGSSILQYLKKKNYSKVYFIDKKKLDLRRQNDVYDFFLKKRFYILHHTYLLLMLNYYYYYQNQNHYHQFVLFNLKLQQLILLINSYLMKAFCTPKLL